MDDRYKGHFFICDFRGGPGNSGVRSFALEAAGAGFKVVDKHDFVSRTLVTDVDFGYDGNMYVSDWTSGWGGSGKGKIHAIHHDTHRADPAVAEVKAAFAAGIEKQASATLAGWLGHADMRLRSQFALAERGEASAELFVDAFLQRKNQLERLHGVWGLGQLARRNPKLLKPALALLADADAEVAVQTAKVVGDAKYAAGKAGLLTLLAHPSNRAKYFAAMALGKIQSTAAMPRILAVLEANQNKDVFLRHVCIMYLVWADDRPAARALTDHSVPEVRLAAVVALRRWRDPRVAAFLTDTDQRVVTEAARAIHDAFLAGVTPALAAVLDGPVQSEQLLYRAINANFRLGRPDDVARLAAYAANHERPKKMRLEALQALVEWAAVSPRDRVLDEHHPLTDRDTKGMAQAVGAYLDSLMKAGGEIQKRTIALIKQHKLEAKTATPENLARDTRLAVANRIAALQLLAERQSSELRPILTQLLAEPQPLIRAHAARVLVTVDTTAGLSALKKALQSRDAVEQQMALETVGGVAADTATSLVGEWMDLLIAGEAPAALQLDILQAAKAQKLAAKLTAYEASLPKNTDALASFRVSLQGGNAMRGKVVFETHAGAQCQRCHKAGAAQAVGGDVGPNLAQLGDRNTRLHLLESIVSPNAKIAPGFEMVIITLKDGKTIAGTLVSDGDKIVIAPLAGKNIVIAADQVASRTSQKVSAMPPMGALLQPGELRDLIEYLSKL